MEVRQYGNTVCIHFIIKPFGIEGMIKRIKKERKIKQEEYRYPEHFMEYQAALERMERNKLAAQNLLRMRQLF